MKSPQIDKSKQIQFNETHIILNRIDLLKLYVSFYRTASTRRTCVECLRDIRRKLEENISGKT
jgi:hypothetical protein